jgi:hypothetical protein
VLVRCAGVQRGGQGERASACLGPAAYAGSLTGAQHRTAQQALFHAGVHPCGSSKACTGNCLVQQFVSRVPGIRVITWVVWPPGLTHYQLISSPALSCTELHWQLIPSPTPPRTLSLSLSNPGHQEPAAAPYCGLVYPTTSGLLMDCTCITRLHTGDQEPASLLPPGPGRDRPPPVP